MILIEEFSLVKENEKKSVMRLFLCETAFMMILYRSTSVERCRMF
ncbi:hypothetical protein [Marinifilum sp. D714]|nr:hypothetical protein [Marinifilum sp. D714]